MSSINYVTLQEEGGDPQTQSVTQFDRRGDGLTHCDITSKMRKQLGSHYLQAAK